MTAVSNELLVCRDVSLGYEGQSVLEHLDLNICAGDYLCIVGENGSGKSTLLKGLLGLLHDKKALLEQDHDAHEEEHENSVFGTFHYFTPPFQASSGSRGRTLLPASDGSTSFSMPGLLRISSKVS